jgi:hypothetical protein
MDRVADLGEGVQAVGLPVGERARDLRVLADASLMQVSGVYVDGVPSTDT